MSSAPAQKFSDRVEDLRNAVGIAADLATSGGSGWYSLNTEDDANSGYLNPFDKEKFQKAFDREEANKTYLDAVQQEDKPYRDMQAAKVQGDVLSAFERDLGMRYRTRVRMSAHSTARLKTHGLNNGPINNGIMNFVKLLLQRGEDATTHKTVET